MAIFKQEMEELRGQVKEDNENITENGEHRPPKPPTDENGNPMKPPKGEHGPHGHKPPEKPVDENGDPVEPPERPVDEDGNPIDPPEPPKDENGNPMKPPKGGHGPHGKKPPVGDKPEGEETLGEDEATLA